MTLKIETVKSTIAPSVKVSAQNTSSNWFGRTASKIGQTTQSLILKMKRVFVDFIKNFPTYANTYIFAGVVGTAVGIGGIFATQLTLKNHPAKRVALTLLFVAIVFASAAVMFTFGKTPLITKTV